MPSDAATRVAQKIWDSQAKGIFEMAEIIDEVNFDRMSLCVSFCRNIPTEFLEKHIVDWPFEQAAKRLFYVTTKPTMPDA